MEKKSILKLIIDKILLHKVFFAVLMVVAGILIYPIKIRYTYPKKYECIIFIIFKNPVRGLILSITTGFSLIFKFYKVFSAENEEDEEF